VNSAIACPHLASQPALDILYVLDSHLHMTDGFVQCADCGATFLVEMADTDNGTSLFRVSALSPSAVKDTIRSLQRGSCDINRARHEVFSVAGHAQELDALLIMQGGSFTHTVVRPAQLVLPKRSWRELPCDGTLVQAVLAASASGG